MRDRVPSLLIAQAQIQRLEHEVATLRERVRRAEELAHLAARDREHAWRFLRELRGTPQRHGR